MRSDANLMSCTYICKSAVAVNESMHGAVIMALPLRVHPVHLTNGA